MSKRQIKNYAVVIVLLQKTDNVLSEELQKNGIPVVELGNGSLYNPFHMLKLYKLLPLFDIIHVHLFPSLYWVSMAKWISRSPQKLFFTEHSTHNRRRDISMLRMTDKWIYSAYSRIIGISGKATANFCNYFPTLSDKAVTIENGIDIEKYAFAKPIERSELGCGQDDFVVVQVANFRIQKDQTTVIHSMKLLPDNVKVVFVGSGPTLEVNTALAIQEGVSDKCVFLGKRMDVPQIIKAANVVVMSSNWEGFGLAAVEGMAASKPVIASDVEGLKEVVGGVDFFFIRVMKENWLLRLRNCMLIMIFIVR